MPTSTIDTKLTPGAKIGRNLAERNKMAKEEPRAGAAGDLQIALEALDAAMDKMRSSEGLVPLARRLASATTVVAEASMLLSSKDGIPPGVPQDRKAVVRLTTAKARAKQDEVVRFIVQRFAESGSAKPVSSSEIIIGTSLKTRSMVQQIVSELVADGSLRACRGRWWRGYIPTSALIDRFSVEPQ